MHTASTSYSLDICGTLARLKFFPAFRSRSLISQPNEKPCTEETKRLVYSVRLRTPMRCYLIRFYSKLLLVQPCMVPPWPECQLLASTSRKRGSPGINDPSLQQEL